MAASSETGHEETAQQELRCLVVGGASGIGLSTVRLLAKRGCAVVFADINEELGRATESGLRNEGMEAYFITIDICNDESIEACIQQAAEILGVIDVAVNTAGITGPMMLGHEVTAEIFQSIIRVDLEGCWRFSKYIISYFRAQTPRLVRHDVGPAWQPVYQRGSLVNFASAIGSLGQPMLAPYCSAKAGVINLSRVLALENAELGIRVNTISPGIVLTPLLTKDPNYSLEFATKHYLLDQPIGRFAHPDEIAAGAVFTALDTASFMTGNDWGPDGGAHIA